jgi:hypothetical protein
MDVFRFTEKKRGKGSTTKDRRGEVVRGSGKGKVQIRSQEILFKIMKGGDQRRGHTCEIILIHNQIFYIRSLIFCPARKEIGFHNVIVMGVSAG